MAPFFDPTRCPACSVILPRRPLRCPACGVELTGPTVTELVTTLRLADSLVGRLRSELVTVEPPQPRSPSTSSRARSWFTGTSVGVILLILGALCVLAAGVVFIAVAWTALPLAIRVLVLVVVTAGFGILAELALRRGLQATAEALAVIASGMFVLDLAAARRAGLPGLGGLAVAPYEIVAGVLLATVAGGWLSTLRSRQRWLWSLDAAVALGMVRAAAGVLRLEGDGYAASSVTVTIIASLLYVAWRRLRLPVARWSAAVLTAMAWLGAVAIGAQRAGDDVGGDIGRLAQAWPALVAALVAGIWSIRLTHAVWRRVAAFGCLLPLLLVVEIIGWSHGWAVGTAVMLAGYLLAALASAQVPSVWSAAVGGSAVVLGVSSLVGLLPTMVTLAARIGLAMSGDWSGMDSLALTVLAADVVPWLLPLTTVVVLALLPQVTVERYRPSLDQHHTTGVFVATLAVLPILYGAGYWTSMVVLLVGGVALLCGARLWGNDVLLLLGLSLLAILRLCGYYDDRADPIAWTLVALTLVAWALTEPRSGVRAGFLVAGGLCALAGTSQWLTFTQVPRPFHGLVIVLIGSLGLLASQRLVGTPRTGVAQMRVVSEGVCATWVVAGLAMAERSPSHLAVELTVVGVATGITAYLSPDRHGVGWASGVLLTAASWIRLADADVQAVEWYTLPAATALLVYGARRRRRDPSESTWRCLGPGLALALTPSLMLALDEPISGRGLLVSSGSVLLVTIGVRARLAAPFAIGAIGTGLLALRNIWPVAAFVPRWTLLFLIGGTLLGMGMTWESRVRDARSASRYVLGLR